MMYTVVFQYPKASITMRMLLQLRHSSTLLVISAVKWKPLHHTKVITADHHSRSNRSNIHHLHLHTSLLLQTITGLERDLAISRTDCTVRDDALGERETRIASMRRRVQELENFKFVLDYKLKETRAALQPKEDEAGSLHDQIQVWHCLVR